MCIHSSKHAQSYFEEGNQEDIITSEIYKGIKKVQVDRFHIIGGGMYKVELCIYLKEDHKEGIF